MHVNLWWFILSNTASDNCSFPDPPLNICCPRSLLQRAGVLKVIVKWLTYIKLVQATKRQPGASGRLHRTVEGEWVWSSEEEDGHSSDEEVITEI